MLSVDRRRFISAAALTSGAILLGRTTLAQQPGTTEPVYRISKNDAGRSETAAHALDPALQIARDCLKHIRENVMDYTAILIKKERIGNTLGDYEYMSAKVRNRKVHDGQIKQPFSVYLGFLKPATVKGREVIYVENRDNGQLTAHEGGFRGRLLPTMKLDPNGMLAMQGQRYPITELGVENLVIKLIEKGERDKHQEECNVEFRRGAKVGGRQCTVLIVTHPVSRPHFDFHVAEVFIDDELQMPVRYAAYTWPTTEGGQRELLEEYTYQNVQVNVGLTDADFDSANKKYNF
jgi:Protein of unknown function (DUF1571)